LWNYLRREHGRGILRYLLWWLLDADPPCPESEAFDRVSGLDTGEELTPDRMGISPEAASHAQLYWPTPCGAFRSQIARLEPGFLARSVFVDLGSGKGRTLILASGFPFREILGIEVSPVLHAIATRNLAIWRRTHGEDGRVKAILADARDFRFPAAPLVLYAYHPFDERVAMQVLASLAVDVAEHPRPVALVYRSPLRSRTAWSPAVLGAGGHLRLLDAEIEHTRFFRAVHSIWVNRWWSEPGFLAWP